VPTMGACSPADACTEAHVAHEAAEKQPPPGQLCRIPLRLCADSWHPNRSTSNRSCVDRGGAQARLSEDPASGSPTYGLAVALASGASTPARAARSFDEASAAAACAKSGGGCAPCACSAPRSARARGVMWARVHVCAPRCPCQLMPYQCGARRTWCGSDCVSVQLACWIGTWPDSASHLGAHGA